MSKVDDDLQGFGEIISFELAQAMKDNTDLLSLLFPVGAIAPLMGNIVGVPAPDPNIWQRCDGSLITNPNSPLFGVGGVDNYTPNLQDRYLKIPSTFGQSGDLGGTNDITQLAHDHGGTTGFFTTITGAEQAKGTALREVVQQHAHGIDGDLAGFNAEPAHITVQFYIRIQ